MATPQIPAELERRIRALETPAGQGDDFDAASWFWLVILGVALPILALVLGWAS